MKHLYLSLFAVLNIITADSNNTKYFVIAHYFHGFKDLPRYYKKEFPVTSEIAEDLKSLMTSDPSLDQKDIWLSLWPCPIIDAGFNSHLKKGYCNLSEFHKLCKYIPEASTCIPELEQRFSAIDELK